MAIEKGTLKTKSGDILYPATSADKVSGLATVATSGSYSDLSNKPDLSTKQDTLYLSPNWNTITWSGFTPLSGRYIWTDGTNIYYSDYNYDNYKLNGTTWESMEWSGFTNIRGEAVWTDGTNTYYSYGADQYKLNGTTWEPVTWSGFTPGSGEVVWTDGTNTYYSANTDQYKLNGTTWELMTWEGSLYPSLGSCIWTDGNSIYYSLGTTHYKLNGTSWEEMTWSGLTTFVGLGVWTDGTNMYYSNYAETQYKLNGTTWEPITWVGFTPLGGVPVWTDGTNTYYSDNANQYKLDASSLIASSVDSTPKENSNNLITSGGVATSLATKQDTLVFNTAYNASTNKAATMADVPSIVKADEEDIAQLFSTSTEVNETDIISNNKLVLGNDSTIEGTKIIL